jgi:peptidoglycan/xylan/chitin deacetylase (PgdA/CDA1 family)
MALTWLLDRLAPAGERGRLSVLIFHRALAQPDELFPGEAHSEVFEQRVQWLRRWFNVLPMAQAIRGLRQGDLPARAAVVTFDDGYADNFEVATPILRRHNCPATFFIAAGFLDGGRMWNDTVIEALRRSPLEAIDLRELGLNAYPLSTPAQRRAAIDAVLNKLKYLAPHERSAAVQRVAKEAKAPLPGNLMLTSEQLRGMVAAGMTIGAHTMTHPILTSLSEAEARDEIARSRDALQNIIQQPVDFFAYPNGKPGQDYAAEHVRIVRELGFEAAFSTAWGSASAGQDMYQIPRFSPWDRTPVRFALRMAQNLRRDAVSLA